MLYWRTNRRKCHPYSAIQTTFDVYGRLLPGSYDDIRARMDAYLAKQVRCRRYAGQMRTQADLQRDIPAEPD
jgi:hypothetical protein